MKKIIASSVIFFSLATVAHAAAPVAVADVTSLSNLFIAYFTTAIQLMMAAAVVFVTWSAFKFVTAGGDEEKRKEGQSGIIYGIIGIVVMASIWGLVTLVSGSTGLNLNKSVTSPAVI